MRKRGIDFLMVSEDEVHLDFCGGRGVDATGYREYLWYLLSGPWIGLIKDF